MSAAGAKSWAETGAQPFVFDDGGYVGTLGPTVRITDIILQKCNTVVLQYYNTVALQY